jgi:1A family penicillin-binding protein
MQQGNTAMQQKHQQPGGHKAGLAQALTMCWRWCWRGGFVTLVLLTVVGVYFWFSTPLPAPDQLRAKASLGNTRILDRNGQLLYQLPDPLSGRQQPVPLESIPLALRQATVAIEDASFYQNPGLDMRGILRAAWANLQHGAVVAGGSTISQQVARTFLLDPSLARQQSFERKLREAVLALKLNASYSKDEILALYLNQVYYGGWNYGVEAAARHYFNKPVADLDLAESALLAGLPQAPSHYDPLTNRAAAATRQAQVLDAMARAGYITTDQAERAKNEEIQLTAEHAESAKVSNDQRTHGTSPSSAPSAVKTTMRAPHFVTYVLDMLARELGPEAVLRGGLTVTTTLDANLNDAAQRALAHHVVHLSTPRNGEPDHRVRNGAVVVLNPADGAILAMVGSPNFDDAASQGQVNAAISLRQPGSAIKPLTYAAALEQGWTPATELLDIPTSFSTREGRPYAPENYDKTFHGPLSLREALATSSNVAAVRTLNQIGIPTLLEMAERLGIHSLGRDSSRYGLSLTLGGGEVTPLELTAAYAAFANGGSRIAPYAIVGIAGADRTKNQESGTRNQACPECSRREPRTEAGSGTAVLDPKIAFLITDILADPYARMRAFGENSPLNLERPAAVKTGTTSDWRDNWAVGYTPDRVVGVWVGNADGSSMQQVSGLAGAGPVWHAVMQAAHQGLPVHSFARPEGIVDVAVCAEGGLLPSPACPDTRLERFVAGTAPTVADNSHLAVQVDKVLGCRPPAGYPPERLTTRVFRMLPPEAEAWAVANGVPQLPRETCSLQATAGSLQPDTDGEKLTGGNQPMVENCQLPTLRLRSGQAANCQLLQPAHPALITPAPGATFTIDPRVPLERQQLLLQAVAGSQASEVRIVVNDETVAAFTGPPYRAFWQLRPGTHRAWVDVRDSDGKDYRSETVVFVVE